MNDQIFTIIQKKILSVFPTLRVILTNDASDGDFFIEINDAEIYNSIEYQNLVMEIKTNILWPLQINQTFFVITSKEEYAIPFPL
jgi:hypothetical protein